jgi:hypothetical protein
MTKKESVIKYIHGEVSSRCHLFLDSFPRHPFCGGMMRGNRG